MPSHDSLPSLLNNLSNIRITDSDVFQALSEIDPSEATGPDGFSPKLLKFCAIAIDIHLASVLLETFPALSHS